ncbi:MAG: orotidine-5'-phosphate decarboxylase [Porticoccus sp.]|nr:orotidine-5'-phosphate decarboxylase [Porticoccus sp.]MBQ0807709.1 orotidine-5'-phosphate decarboxylase [Porticoccus sp.]MDX2350359.1 orotidine-5'-phosphate decarboxylase [Porticoccus sp.]
MSDRNSNIIVALDYNNVSEANHFVDSVSPDLCKLKVGKELFTRAGPQFVTGLVGKGFDVFLDLKFHDIPNTVSKAVKAAADLGVWMTDVHASGGRRMMEDARNVLEQNSSDMLLIAVTVLTSFAKEDLAEIGIDCTPEEQVHRLAALAQSSGMDGVVSSAMEASGLRQALGDDFALVTPGIRPASAVGDDQRRVVTPAQAMANGSSYLVIGRPITQSETPVETLLAINREISQD